MLSKRKNVFVLKCFCLNVFSANDCKRLRGVRLWQKMEMVRIDSLHGAELDLEAEGAIVRHVPVRFDPVSTESGSFGVENRFNPVR